MQGSRVYAGFYSICKVLQYMQGSTVIICQMVSIYLQLWNSIPGAIRLCNTVITFKICIKTYLFSLAYPITQQSVKLTQWHAVTFYILS